MAFTDTSAGKVQVRSTRTVTRFWSSRVDDDALGTVTEHVKKLDAWLGARTSCGESSTPCADKELDALKSM